MNRNEVILKYSLLAGTVYFVCMCVAHFLSFKVPLLFIYYDVPSTHYQNQIISFSVLAFVALSYSASQNRSVVPSFLLSMFGVVFGLSYINGSNSLSSVMIEGTSTTPYWLQTGLIAFYVVWLVVFYFKPKKST